MKLLNIIKQRMRKEATIICPLIIKNSSEILRGKTVLITGGATGIGKATATKLVSEGASVIIVGRREDKLKETSQIIGSECKYLVEDITNVEYKKWFERVERNFGKTIDIFINNAGLYIDREQGGYSESDFDSIINLNLKASFFLLQSYFCYCKEKGIKGNMIITSSNRALFGDVGPYGISKAGVSSIVQGFAREYSQFGLRVNAVAPGMTASEINGVNPEGDLAASYIRGGRILRAEEIAEVICFLAEDSSNCINGVVIPCDNGDNLR